MLRAAPYLVVALMIAPVAAGLLGAIGPAFGRLPAIGRDGFSLQPWVDLFAHPGVWRSALISLGVGLASAAISFAAVMLFLATASQTRLHRALVGMVSPLLSVPHAAAALGLAFLIAPSGWLMRLVSPWATGFERPPDLLIVHDPYGLAMIAGLVMKEIPFLLLIALAALPQVDPARKVRAARAMGYGQATGWLKVVLPSLYPLIRLPLYAVIAYAASNVDVALILGPTRPPPLSVSILSWMNDPDLDMRLMASAAALLQFALVLLALGIWRLGEIAAWRFGRAWATDGGRRAGARLLGAFGVATVGLAAAALVLGLIGLFIASISGFWRFPAAFPDGVTALHWLRASDGLIAKLQTTALIAVISASLSIILVTALLEAETRSPRTGPSPLIAPQVSFLFGLTVGAESLGVPPSLLLVALAHAVFVLPYVYLSLAGAYRRFDPRWIRAARSLGETAAGAFWRVRAPMLLKPALTAFAVGLAVSIGQYLPTQLLGAGRVTTVTTEAVALAAGGDRRVIGVWALAQALLPALGFWLAMGAPRALWRNRRGMRDAV